MHTIPRRRLQEKLYTSPVFRLLRAIQEKGICVEPSQRKGHLVLRVPPKLCIEEPIVLSDLPRTITIDIAFEAGASGIVVDSIEGKGEIARELTLHVGEHSNVSCISLVHPSRSSHVQYIQRGMVGECGSLQWHNITSGGKEIYQDLSSEVTGSDGQSVIHWSFAARNEAQYELRVCNHFLSPHGRGEVIMKGIACGKAYAKAFGLIDIGSGGTGTSTHLTQHVLMLDATAKVDAIPALEIKTNDVKASHSATVTKVSEEDIFYLGSRGIAKKEARSLLIEGFLVDLVGRIPVVSLRRTALSSLLRPRTRRPRTVRPGINGLGLRCGVPLKGVVKRPGGNPDREIGELHKEQRT